MAYLIDRITKSLQKKIISNPLKSHSLRKLIDNQGKDNNESFNMPTL